ncbi:hypothetical protein GCM10020367_70570 [Streptomyces sannanensis]|uniref:Uncharacterized protein n=1 Tax=Streptomyces sannanensis TaxID=285536 RepID=A0ABP6SNU3_9ACTN
MDADLAPWEADVLPDPDGTLPEAAGPVSLLTARAQHALLLVPDDERSSASDLYVSWAWPTLFRGAGSVRDVAGEREGHAVSAAGPGRAVLVP